MRIDIEELRAMRERRKEINNTPLEKIEYYFNGKKIDVPLYTIDEWKYIGLSNIDFDWYMLEGDLIEIHYI